MPSQYGVASGPAGVTAGQHRFSKVPSVSIGRSKFDRSCGARTTLNAGDLIPVFVDEVLPGDTFRMSPTFFGRMATLLHPIMENLFLDVFWFFVPNRLVWTNWEKMNGAQDDPGDSTDFQVPIMTAPAPNGYAEMSLQDQMGLPPGVDGYTHSALPLRGYNLIWNEWFRDQNLQDSVVVDKDDGPDTVTDYVILKRGKRHDYFTSCLPFPQKGPAVSLPLGLTAPVIAAGDKQPQFVVPGDGNNFKLQAGNSSTVVRANATISGSFDEIEWVDPKLQTDLSLATAATINQLRESFQIQRMFERDARGGTRYTEILRSHFGVVSPDQRLQRPEFLGGGTMRINVNPVANTVRSANLAESYLGDLGAFVTFSGVPRGFTKSFTEHGHVIGMVSIRADLNYQQGLERMWSRRRRFEFYWPSFAHLGEQAVLNKELFVQGTAADEDVFGYQERFAEYRYKPSQVRGEMRSSSVQSLDTWHLSQDFASLPLLNEAFIVENPPIDRVVAVVDAPKFLLDCWFELSCVRPMPVYGVPGLIDHF